MRSLLLACLLIGAVAVATPTVFNRYLEPPDRAEHLSVETLEGQAPDEGNSAAPRQVSIKVGRDGHFYVDANINFRPVRLMVDTGATVVALRASDAIAAGIRVRDADFTNPVQTANGTTNAAEATLESVSVSDIEVRNIRALIIPDDQLAISLLGGTFLQGLERFEVADGTLIFEN